MNALRAIILVLSGWLLLALVLPVSGQTGIIVNNAHSVRTVDTVSSPTLNNLLGGVQARIVAQFANNLRTMPLSNVPAPLQNLLSSAAQRIVAQYGNSVRHADLVALPGAIQTLVANVSVRVVIQSANSNRQFAMAYPRALLNDIVAPMINNFTNGVDAGNTKVQWNTDEFTRCTLRYGTQPATYTEVIESPLYAKQHGATLNNVTSGATYYLQVSCTDQSDNATTSSEFSFTTGTPPPTPSATPPSTPPPTPLPPQDTIQVATSSALPNALIKVSTQIIVPQYSLDGGQSWRSFATTPWDAGLAAPQITLAPRNIVTAPVRFIVAAPSTPVRTAPRHSGIFRTGDNGLTWATYTPPIEPLCTETFVSFSNLTNSPPDPARLYVLVACYNFIASPLNAMQTNAMTQSSVSANPEDYFPRYSLFTSSDAGVTWQQVTLPPDTRPSLAQIEQLLPSPVLPGRLYAYMQSTSANTIENRWHQSDDNGQTWVTTSFVPTVLALDAANANLLYGIFDAGSGDPARYTGKRSIDGGNNWIAWGQQPCLTSFRQLLALPGDGLLLLRCDQGIYRSRNGGDAWEQLTNLSGQLLVVDYSSPGRALWFRDGVSYESSDQGTTWNELGERKKLWLPVIRGK